jgi:hypothetical protein
VPTHFNYFGLSDVKIEVLEEFDITPVDSVSQIRSFCNYQPLLLPNAGTWSCTLPVPAGIIDRGKVQGSSC